MYFSRTTRRTALALVVAFVVALGLLYLDRPIVEWLRPFYKASPFTPLLERFDSVVSFLGHGTTQAVAIVILYILGIFLSPKLREAGKGLFIGFLGSGALAQILKHLLGRARPRVTTETFFIGPTMKASYDSFPSGHTIVTFCLAYILAFYFPRYRWWFFAFATVVALERVVCVTHFPSDVAAGAAIGLLAGIFFRRKVFPRFARGTERRL
jgi:membrane-associated phospholipid phosphatase